MSGEHFTMRRARARAVRHSWALRAPVAKARAGWMEKRACKDRAAFFSTSNTTLVQVRAICEGCPVRLDCLAECHRLEQGERYAFGVYGGLTPAERQKGRSEDLRAGKQRTPQ